MMAFLKELLWTPHGLGQIVFAAFVGATLLGALVAVNTQRLIRSVVGLALCYFGVAGLAFFLKAPFVGLMVVLIYVGAVCITIVFGIMMAGASEKQPTVPLFSLQATGAGMAALAILWAMGRLNLGMPWPISGRTEPGTVEQIGRAFLTTHSLVFELISLVLLAAILGALVVVRSGRGRR